MNRPPLRGGRSGSRRGGRTFIERIAGGSPGNTYGAREPSRAVAPPPWAGISMSASPLATVRLSLTTACRNRHCPKCQANARSRWLQARRQEPLPTRYVHVVFTLPHRNWRRSPCRTRNSCTISCCRPVPQLSSKSLAIPNISARRSAASVCSTPGIKNSNTTRTCIVSCPPADCRSIAPIGSSHAIPSSFPSGSQSRLRGKFVAALKRNFRQGKLGFHGNLKTLAHPKVFSAWLRTLFRNDWHVYSKRPFRRCRACALLFGPVHPSRRHLQPPTRLLGR